jgi:hypothetical protein
MESPETPQEKVDEQARLVAQNVRERARGVAFDILEEAKELAAKKITDVKDKSWTEKSVPFAVFTWAIGIILIIIGILFNLNLQMGSRVDKLDQRITLIIDGQTDLRDTLIRLDERQQVNIQNVIKIMNKLNIN